MIFRLSVLVELCSILKQFDTRFFSVGRFMIVQDRVQYTFMFFYTNVLLFTSGIKIFFPQCGLILFAFLE